MRRWTRATAGLVLVAALPMSACSGEAATAAKKEAPYTLEKADGVTRVRMEQRVFDRIRIQTSTVGELERFGGETARKVVDYPAVVYEPTGDTAVYTNPSPLVFVRRPVTVEYVEGDLAVLSEGPPAGTAVVTVGTAELLGMEFGVGK